MNETVLEIVSNVLILVIVFTTVVSYITYKENNGVTKDNKKDKQ
jgi:hypothetical protein